MAREMKDGRYLEALGVLFFHTLAFLAYLAVCGKRGTDSLWFG